jgi:hypothetical protein
MMTSGGTGAPPTGPMKARELRVAEELLKVPDTLPFVRNKDKAVTDRESVVNPARRLGGLADLRELARPIGKRLAELSGIRPGILR